MALADVSVVIPTHDRQEMLVGAVHTALVQDDVDVEVIVVDDGSTDATAAVVRERFPAVTVLRNERSSGVSAARNQGIDRATGAWVAFLDDDDLWAPDKLAAQVAALQASRRGWGYAGAVSIAPDLRIVHGTHPDPAHVIHRDLPVRNRLPAGPSNVIVHRQLLTRTGGFDVHLRPHADWDLWIRLAQSGPPACVDRPLVGYTLHGENMSVRSGRTKVDDAWLDEVDVIEQRYAQLRGDRRVDRGMVWRWIAGSHLRRGRWRDGARAYLEALREAPWESLRLGFEATASSSVGRSTAFRQPPDRPWRDAAEAWLRPLRDMVDVEARKVGR